MLRKAHDLIGFGLQTTDGKIGEVTDFYFDDEKWTIRYVVVNTGSWLFGRQVVISPTALGKADWENELLGVQLTKEQVENSPDIDTEKPVSRQHEAELADYYGWPSYWDTPALYAGIPDARLTAGLGTAIATPTGVATVPVASRDPLLRNEDVRAAVEHAHEEGESHLRSIKDTTGYHIQATDEEIGHVADFFVDEADWVIRYLLVDTRNWWPGKKVLIAPGWISSISWAASKVYVNVDRKRIELSPEYDPSAPLERSYESKLYSYYGYPGYWR